MWCGYWLPCSKETTTVAMLIPFNSASAAAKNLGCKLLFPLSPSATIQYWCFLHGGCQDSELPLASNGPTLLQHLGVGSHYSHRSQPPWPISPREGRNECREAWGFSLCPRLRSSRAWIIPASVASATQESLPYKDHLSVPHTHAMYT